MADPARRVDVEVVDADALELLDRAKRHLIAYAVGGQTRIKKRRVSRRDLDEVAAALMHIEKALRRALEDGRRAPALD